VGSLTQKGTGFGCWGPLLPWFAFEASSYPCVIGLSDVERRWIACRWSDLMQVATWGSATSMCAFQVSSIVGSPHQRWVTFVLFMGQGDLTWDVWEWETRWCHLWVQGGLYSLWSGGKHPWAAMDLQHIKRWRTPHHESACLSHTSRWWPRKRIGK